jgi:hypothetical protein
MRKLGLLCTAMLCLAGTAAAQNNTTATVATGTGDAAQTAGAPSTDVTFPWQAGMNFAYMRHDISSDNNNLYGIQSSVTRFFGSGMFGIEGSATATFGDFSPKIAQRLATYEGGLHVAKRYGKLQPWGHVLAGGAHERISQGDGPASFNGFSLIGGGGVDIQLRPRLAWRVQGDFLATHLGGAWQETIIAGTGLIISF